MIEFLNANTILVRLDPTLNPTPVECKPSLKMTCANLV